jgi:FAD/FMN-containing dehydrogenase
MNHVLGAASVRELQSQLPGAVLTAGEPNYETARQIWNSAFDKRPAVIVRATSTQDVVRTVLFARSEGLPLAVRGGGHSIAGFSTCDGGMVLDLSSMNDVQVDIVERRAIVGGGATWKRFDAATQSHGLAATGGMISSTGVGGLTLGGGIGHLMRKQGLACDHVRSLELVTAEGSVLSVTESQHPDLLWALKGGGGNFGVVTKFDFALQPVGPTVLGGAVFYPGEEASEVLSGWRDALPGMPDELTTTVNLTTAPPVPFIADDWHYRKVVAVIACWAGDIREGEAVVAPLRALGTPISDVLGAIPYVEMQQLVDPLWEPGAANYFTSTFLDGLPDEAVAKLCDHHREAADPPAQMELHVHQLGGAVARVPATDTPFGHRSSPFLLNCVARTANSADLSQQVAWARAARNDIGAFVQAATYANYAGEAGEHLVRASYPPMTLARLQAVKNQYDPSNLFRFNLNIPPTL